MHQISFLVSLAVIFTVIMLWLLTENRNRYPDNWAGKWRWKRGSTNQAKYDVPQNRRWFSCPSAVTSGMPVLIGTLAAVALDAYDSSTGGTTFYMDGSYFLTVIAQSTQSPVSGEQINPGDELFATGTLDATTNITYSLTIDKTRGNCPFGNYEGPGPILSGVTNTAAMVRLKVGGSGPYAS